MRRMVLIATFCFAALPSPTCRSSVDELRVQCAFAIQNGLDFVAGSQTSPRGFATDCWHTDPPEQKTPGAPAFSASQVLYSLSFSPQSPRPQATQPRPTKDLLS